MQRHWRCLLALLAMAAVAFTAWERALAVDDKDFCVAAQQLALATEKDVGLWTDRMTRNAGMVVTCPTKTVVFKRFTYASSPSMDKAWKERKAAEWNASHCGRSLWAEAIRDKWNVVLSVTAADGGNASFTAQCN